MAVVPWQWFTPIVVAVAELNINRSSIRRHRRRHRAKLNVTLKEELMAGGLIVHWDGKLMQDLSSKQQVEQLPILAMARCSFWASRSYRTELALR